MATTLRIEVAPATLEQQQEEGMVAVCCDWYERAIAAGLVKISRFGIPYLHVDRVTWAIKACPWCATPIEDSHAHAGPAAACTREDLIAAIANHPTMADAAKALGIARTTFYYRLRKCGLDHLIKGDK